MGLNFPGKNSGNGIWAMPNYFLFHKVEAYGRLWVNYQQFLFMKNNVKPTLCYLLKIKEFNFLQHDNMRLQQIEHTNHIVIKTVKKWKI